MKFQARMLLLTALAAVSGMAAAEGDGSAADVAAAEENRQIGYALGYSAGQRLGVDRDLDVKAFNEGFADAFGKTPSKLSPEQVEQAFARFQERMTLAMQAQHQQLLKENQAKADEFLAKNGKRKGVKQTASGLQYEVLARGKGKSPGATDLVRAHYRGTHLDGKEFDTSAGGDPVEFPLDRVIAGWREGVSLMNKGAKYRFWIPPHLAYGEEGASQVIGPNEALVFEVELVDFNAAPPEPAGIDSGFNLPGEEAAVPPP
ncbi:MAG: FKBP-type peptidyl-prolyl cis-trans isomerase [Pseudomonadota bacterium]